MSILVAKQFWGILLMQLLPCLSESMISKHILLDPLELRFRLTPRISLVSLSDTSKNTKNFRPIYYFCQLQPALLLHAHQHSCQYPLCEENRTVVPAHVKFNQCDNPSHRQFIAFVLSYTHCTWTFLQRKRHFLLKKCCTGLHNSMNATWSTPYCTRL